MNTAENLQTPSSNPYLTNLVSQVKLVLTDPKGCWNTFREEQRSDLDFAKQYLLPIAAIAPICGFIRGAILGHSIPYVGTWREPFFSSLIGHGLQFVFSIISFFIGAFIAQKAAEFLGSKASRSLCLRLLGYSATAASLVGVLQLFGFFAMLFGIIGAGYTIYTFWQGISPMTGLPENKRLGFVGLMFIGMLVVNFVFVALNPFLAAPPTQLEVNGQGAIDLNQLNKSLEGVAKSLPH